MKDRRRRTNTIPAYQLTNRRKMTVHWEVTIPIIFIYKGFLDFCLMPNCLDLKRFFFRVRLIHMSKIPFFFCLDPILILFFMLQAENSVIKTLQYKIKYLNKNLIQKWENLKPRIYAYRNFVLWQRIVQHAYFGTTMYSIHVQRIRGQNAR